MKFENGVTRKFKEHSLSKVHVMSAFSYLIPRHHLPKSRQNRSIKRQWKVTNLKTYKRKISINLFSGSHSKHTFTKTYESSRKTHETLRFSPLVIARVFAKK